MTDIAISPTRSRAERVLSLARSMLVAAEAELWDEVARIEPEWSAAVRNLFERGPVDEEESQFLASVLTTVRNIQAMVAEKVLAERDRAASELRRIRDGRQVERSYRLAVKTGTDE